MGKRGGGGRSTAFRPHSSGHSKARHSTSSRSHSSGHSRAGHSKVSHAAAARIVKANHKKGTAFEKHSSGFRTSSVKTQVQTKRHGRADIVARTKTGQKVVLEAKNYRGNPVTKGNVKQVKGYAKDLKAKSALVVSKTTTVPSAVRNYANQRDVPIIKM